MRLSDHFTLSELTKSETASRKGIKNKPSDTAVVYLILVCNEILEPEREKYKIPFSPSSGFRCIALNRAIGSSDNSQHIEGKAVDFEIPGVGNKEVALWVKENVDFDQLILEFHKEEDPKSGWIHCSYNLDREHRKSARIFDGRKWTALE